MKEQRRSLYDIDNAGYLYHKGALFYTMSQKEIHFLLRFWMLIIENFEKFLVDVFDYEYILIIKKKE